MVAVIEGLVVAGRKLGRQLGFPTANVLIPAGVSIESGVYSSRVVVGGVRYGAVTNVGVNPTVGEVSRRAESYILDFDGDIYGFEIRVELCEWLRGEMKFESVDALREQIGRDIEYVRSKYNNI